MEEELYEAENTMDLQRNTFNRVTHFTEKHSWCFEMIVDSGGLMEYVHGGDIYTYEGMLDFSANINPFGPSPGVMDAVAASARRIGAYPDSRCRRLRDAVSQAEGVPKDSIVFGNGAADLIFSLVFAKRPKKAVLTAPSFLEYAQALRAVGCEIVYHRLKEAEDFRLGENYLEKLTRDVDIVFLCSPDNPTGQEIEKELLLKIIHRCEEHHILLVLDECFYEFLEDQEDVLTPKEALESPWVFLMRAFTKMHAMPGLRLGYGFSANEGLLERLSLVRQPWSVSVAAQEAGLAALSEQDRVERTRAFVKEERRWMEERLDQIGVKHFPSAANYILLKSSYDLSARLKEKKILIRDCSNYEGLEKGYYRTAVKLRSENEQLLKALEEIYRNEKSEEGGA